MNGNEVNMSEELKRLELLNFLQWNDRHGCYTDQNCDLESVSRLSFDDAIKYFFGLMNEDFYYSKVDNIFELSYNQTIDYAKQNDFYDRTMENLGIVLQKLVPNDSFYKILI